MPTERSTLSSAQRCSVQRRTFGSPWAMSVIVPPAKSGRHDDVSALQLQPDQEDVGVIARTGVGLQQVVAVLALEPEIAVELVGQRGAERHSLILALLAARAGARVADVFVPAIARLQRPDQPAPQRMIDLYADVAAQRAGPAGDHGFLGAR